MAPALAARLKTQMMPENLSIEFEINVPYEAIVQAIADIRQGDQASLRANVDPDALEGLKFSACLPPAMAMDLLARRALDTAGVDWVLKSPVRVARAV